MTGIEIAEGIGAIPKIAGVGATALITLGISERIITTGQKLGKLESSDNKRIKKNLMFD